MNMRFLMLPMLLSALAVPELVTADSESTELQLLQQRVSALEQRVIELERTRSFTGFMPDFAERFHVMHYAGEAGDWAVASHELDEMQRITELSSSIDRETGALMQSMMEPSFEALKAAIEHGNAKKFARALEHTINACNGCHVATGSEFIAVTLDAPDSLNMRHPHALAPRHAPSGHTHGHSSQ